MGLGRNEACIHSHTTRNRSYSPKIVTNSALRVRFYTIAICRLGFIIIFCRICVCEWLLCFRVCGFFEGVVNDAFEVCERGLCEASVKCLVWRVAIVIDEIAAHPPDFTEFLSCVTVERLECRVIHVDECVVVVVHIVLIGGVWV